MRVYTVCLWVGWEPWCTSGDQKATVWSLFSLSTLHGFWGLNVGHQACTTNTFTRQLIMCIQIYFPYEEPTHNDLSLTNDGGIQR